MIPSDRKIVRKDHEIVGTSFDREFFGGSVFIK